MVAKGMWFLLRDENVLKFVVIATLICEYTKKHRIIYFKWASCMVYELYLNKVIILKRVWSRR